MASYSIDLRVSCWEDIQKDGGIVQSRSCQHEVVQVRTCHSHNPACYRCTYFTYKVVKYRYTVDIIMNRLK